MFTTTLFPSRLLTFNAIDSWSEFVYCYIPRFSPFKFDETCKIDVWNQKCRLGNTMIDARNPFFFVH